MVTEFAARQETEQRDPRLESLVLQLFQSASTPHKLAVLRAIPTGTLENPALSMTDISRKSGQAIALVSTCTEILDRAEMVTSAGRRKGTSTQTSLTILGREVIPPLIEAMQTYFEATQTRFVFPHFMPNVLNTLLSARASTGERRDNPQYITILPNVPTQVKALQEFGEDSSEGFVLNSKGVHLYQALLKIRTAVLDHKEEILETVGPLSLLEKRFF